VSKVTFTYTIPESIRANPGTAAELPHTVTMRALTADEELQAHKVGGSQYMKSQYDAVKRSVVALDGTPVSYADGGTEHFWAACGPKMRSLLMQAYNRLSSPEASEEADFFASVQIQAG
jgi:hypothetical protein